MPAQLCHTSILSLNIYPKDKYIVVVRFHALSRNLEMMYGLSFKLSHSDCLVT
jgi:hypothetical protein